MHSQQKIVWLLLSVSISSLLHVSQLALPRVNCNARLGSRTPSKIDCLQYVRTIHVAMPAHHNFLSQKMNTIANTDHSMPYQKAAMKQLSGTPLCEAIVINVPVHIAGHGQLLGSIHGAVHELSQQRLIGGNGSRVQESIATGAHQEGVLTSFLSLTAQRSPFRIFLHSPTDAFSCFPHWQALQTRAQQALPRKALHQYAMHVSCNHAQDYVLSSSDERSSDERI